MLEVIDKNVTEINGQKLVPMKDTKVRTSARWIFQADTSDRVSAIDVPAGSKSAWQSLWWNLDESGK
jgi:hypothetical protein